MALDGIFLYHLKNEILDFCLGSRIEKIYQPSKEELVFSVRNRDGAKKLMLSCRASTAGVYFTENPPENPSKPPMVCMLFRKHLTSSRIVDIKQDGLERVLCICVESINELGDRVKLNIYVEIMGRYSNIILTTEDDVIIDSLKRIDETKSQVREVLPGLQYVSPPKQNKLNIFSDDVSIIENALEKSDKSKAKSFQEIVMGVSPIICREYEEGTTLDVIKKYALNPKPYIIKNEKLIDFTFMPIYQYGSSIECVEFTSFSEVLDYFYFEKARLERIRQKSSDLFKKIETLQERAVRKAENRKKELEDCKDKEKYKVYGDLIVSYQYQLKKGSLYYDLVNYYDDNATVRIPALPYCTPMEMAQKYYKEYRKKQVAEQKLSKFIKDAYEEKEYLDSVLESLTRAEFDSEISEIKAELAQAGYIKNVNNNKKKVKPLKPLEYETEEGYKIFVGKNNLMNDRLTFKQSKNYDLWFHIKNEPGSHVVVQSNGSQYTDLVIRQAAMLAVYNSAARDSSNVAVDYTIIKNVHKPNGAKPGFVIYTENKTEYVTPNRAELERIKQIV